MSQGGVYFPGLKGDAALAARIEMFQSTHVVKTVGQLDDDYPCIRRHRQQKFPIVFDLAFRQRAKFDARNLGESVYQRRNFCTEFLADLVQSNLTVFHHIMQK